MSFLIHFSSDFKMIELREDEAEMPEALMQTLDDSISTLLHSCRHMVCRSWIKDPTMLMVENVRSIIKN